MAYIVNKRDGTVIATIADGTLDTTATSVTLLGKGFNNYGEIVAEDFVHMIENFAAVTDPANALRGQLWFDTTVTEEKLKLNISLTSGSPDWIDIQGAIILATEPTSGFGKGTFWFDTVTESLSVSTDGSTFTGLKAVSIGPTPPVGPTIGDLWFDESTSELKVFNDNIHGTSGDDWDVVGPPRYSSTEPVTDRADGDFWWNSNTKQLFAFDAAETEYRLIGPATASGLSSGDTSIVGETLNGLPILMIVIDDEIIGIWSRAVIDVTALNAADLLKLNGALTPSATGFAPTINRGLNLNQNVGPNDPTPLEPTLFTGTATEAFFADLAERYAADGPVEAGELVSLGGEAEITLTTVENDFNIFGVVSTNPGLKLNSSVGNDQTHPYIALTGRVPCKVDGPVRKGDRLVSSKTPGVAKAVETQDIMKLYPAIFGRALETDLTEGQKTIEVTIGVK